jgi:hypothetical protein
MTTRYTARSNPKRGIEIVTDNGNGTRRKLSPYATSCIISRLAAEQLIRDLQDALNGISTGLPSPIFPPDRPTIDQN